MVEQGFFSYFPPLKPRCVLWSSASYSPKSTVYYFDAMVSLVFLSDSSLFVYKIQLISGYLFCILLLFEFNYQF